MRDFVSAQNIIVAFYWEYFMYRYLYFTTAKQWSKYYYISKEYLLVNIPSYLEQGVKVMIGIKHNDTQGIDH